MSQIQPPTSNLISQGKHGVYNAVDFSTYKDTAHTIQDKNIYASEEGTITAYGDSGTCGNRLELVSSDGARRWGHCHLEKALVSVGMKVKRGQLIGIMGYTGYTLPDDVPAGSHLHQVCYTGGKYVYPPTLYNVPFSVYSDDMITEKGLSIVAHYYCGRDPSADEKSKYIGKMKFDDVVEIFRTSKEYDSHVKAFSGSSKIIKKLLAYHLPSRMR